MQNNTLSRAELDATGDVLDIHYGDVLIKYGSILDATDNTIPHIISGHESTNCGYLQDGDIVIADTAEDETVGKTIELLNVSKRKVEAGLHTVPCRPLFPFASMYLGYYMNTPHFHKQLIPLMQGIKVLSISKGNISKTEISSPQTVAEQKKISQFLYLLDQRAAAQGKVIKALKKYKRGLVKLVFEQTTMEAQQQLPLSEMCISISSGRTTVSDTDGSFPLFGSTGVVGKTDTIEFDGEIVLVARVGANAGRVNYFSGQCAVTDNTLVIRVKENIVRAKFLAYFLEYYDLHRLIFGSGQPLVTGGQLKKIEMPVVSRATQDHITKRFEALDNIIDAHETYALNLFRLKSGLMQQLFI